MMMWSTRFLFFAFGFVVVQIFVMIYIDNNRSIADDRLAEKMGCMNLGSVTETNKIKVFDCNGELKLVKVQ